MGQFNPIRIRQKFFTISDKRQNCQIKLSMNFLNFRYGATEVHCYYASVHCRNHLHYFSNNTHPVPSQ